MTGTQLMCDTVELSASRQPNLVNTVEDTTKKVSQGTQIPWRPRPPPLRHHASEMLLSPRRTPNSSLKHNNHSVINSPSAYNTQLPFFTARSGQPYDTIYNTYANRVRRRPQPYPTDSPTSSLDCIPLKNQDWNIDLMSPRMNGSGESSKSCRCHCRGQSAENAPDSPDTLSWRRLHMSRAKLKATATTSELLSGFAMIAMVELQINEPTNVPEWLFIMFAVCTTVLVAVHIFALMISTYLLPNIDAASKISAGDVLRESPHERMRGFIELAWAFSTVLGLFLFLVEIAILCWVKFWDYSFAAATAATVIVIPVLIVFVAFAIHFYHSLVVHKYESSNEDIEQLENMKRNLDSATSNVNSPV